MEEPQTPDDAPERDEDLPEFDFADPLKRGDDEELPGIDPVVTVPPE